MTPSTQKEEKIRILKQRLAERESKGDAQSGSQQATINGTNQLGLNQGKENVFGGGLQVIIQAEQPTASDFDSAFGNGFSYSISACTRSSDVEFSESYL
jgi:hypothetical protein